MGGVITKRKKHTKHKTPRLLRGVAKLSTRTKVLIGVSLFALIAYSLVFILPKPVAYAYGTEECTRQLTLFPGAMKQTTGSGYHVEFKDLVVVGDVPVAAMKSCFQPTAPPIPGKSIVRVSSFGVMFGIKHYQIAVPDAPTARAADFIGKTLPLTRPISIDLSSRDEIFSYSVAAEGKSTECSHDNGVLSCDLETLGLEQGKEYTAQLDRYYGAEKIATLNKGLIKTLEALTLVNASVAEGQTIYDKPASFNFEYDKELVNATAELKQRNGDALEVIPVTTTVDGKTIIVTPNTELKRNTTFELTVTHAEAKNGSGLPGAQKVAFIMSGGPKVIGISAPASGGALAGTITVTFDQEIANVDAIGKLVAITGVNATVSKSGNSLRISYNGGKCATYNITVKKGLESAAKVAQTEDWGFAGRLQCYTLRTIGTSKNGRAINAYIFGSGGRTVLYTGQIHGNEYSARNLMNAWVDEIEANPQNIPENTQLVVIPTINPDGSAAGTRTNANNVDLNRNFDVSDWKSDIQTVNGQPFAGGGGPTPMSEPETQAIANYTRQLAPTLTMSYHAAAAYVIGNTCGDTAALASTYASMVRYRNMTGVSGAFAYQITGTYDDWICEKLGRRSVLVELTTNTGAEFARHKAALWLMSRS